MRRLIVLVVLVAGLAFAACSSGGGESASRSPGADASPNATSEPTAAHVVVPVIQPQQGLTTVQIAEKLAPSIVRVQTEGAQLDIFGNSTPGGGVGTGVIYDSDGHIVTNNHVVMVGNNVADRITVTLNDQRTVHATLVGRDAPTDLAVLKIDENDLTPATFGDSGSLQVGQDVVAIGFALDLKGAPTVTRGVISATGRSIDEPQYTINDAIQTDASINPGNSGGPLVNASGEVVGINTAIVQGAQSIGFSISSTLVQPTVNALIQNGKIDRAYMGIGTVDVTDSIAQNFNLPVDKGIAVTQVAQGGPADQAGLQANDVIVKIDDTEIANSGDLLAVLAKHRAGDQVTVQYYRGNEQQSTDLTLGSRPND